MDRKSVIKILEEIALLLELKGENPFKVRAYQNAARAIPALEEDLEELVRTGELGKKKGFGKALVEKLGELYETGSLGYLDDLRAQFPDSLVEIMNLNGVGPKKARLFYDKLEVATVADLESACQDGRVAELPGCGEKTAEKILQSIKRARESESLFLYNRARVTADTVLVQLRNMPEVERIELAGSLRRYKEVTKDIDILASSAEPAVVMDKFVSLVEVAEVLAHGETKSTAILKNGMQCDLRLVDDSIFPFALHHFTGSKEHNVAIRSRAIDMGMKVSEWGLFDERGDGALIPCADESELFAKLELQWIPPELRENLGEIEHAESDDAFPELVADDAYQGVLHCHTHASDGSNSVEELLTHARRLGHSFLGITDHSRSSFQANGLDIDRLLQQVDKIQELQAANPDMTLFAGVECDILADGSLDYPDEVLDQLDFLVISVHNAFSRSEEEMTARVIRAMEHPRAKILAHPTGRLLLRRDAYAIDLDQIVDAAVANGVAIELNCQPMRMDMDWRRWRKARERGVLCSLNPDAHSLEHFSFVEQGLGFCRKGWLAADDVINCWSADRVKAFLTN